jgi:hypothetical protein
MGPGFRILMPMALLCLAALAHGHPGGASDLRLDFDTTPAAGRWEISLLDLAMPMGLDVDGDGAITRGEVGGRLREMTEFVLRGLTVRRGGSNCRTSTAPVRIERREVDTVAILSLAFRCEDNKGPVRIEYRLLFDLDPTHRGLAELMVDGQVHTVVFSPRSRRYETSHED